MKTLFLLCGPAGCGKTTWVKNRLVNESNAAHISRDEVRFSIIKDKEEYFSHEKEVFSEFISRIKSALKAYDVVYVDATHLYVGGREKVLSKLSLEGVEVVAVNFETTAATCIEQNKNRSGRAYVPDEVIERMCNDFVPAHFGESSKYNYSYIMKVEGKVF